MIEIGEPKHEALCGGTLDFFGAVTAASCAAARN